MATLTIEPPKIEDPWTEQPAGDVEDTFTGALGLHPGGGNVRMADQELPSTRVTPRTTTINPYMDQHYAQLPDQYRPPAVEPISPHGTRILHQTMGVHALIECRGNEWSPKLPPGTRIEYVDEQYRATGSTKSPRYKQAFDYGNRYIPRTNRTGYWTRHRQGDVRGDGAVHDFARQQAEQEAAVREHERQLQIARDQQYAQAIREAEERGRRAAREELLAERAKEATQVATVAPAPAP